MKGQPVILLGDAPADLPESLRRLCSEALTLPRPGRALISAALALLYPEGGKEPSGALTDDTLPDDTALARLSPLELSAALHAGSRSAVLAALDRLCAPAPQAATGKVQGLDAVAGQPRAIAMLHRLCDDITAWREGQLAWSAVPRSLILHGPPGTGKTLLAQAFAAQAGLPLIATSFADCQKAGHLGDMLATLDGTVAEAANRAPAVFFLDELDGFGRREASDIGKGSTYMRAVITGLLRQIDRLMATEGVVLIGATNDLGAIDPAIRRAGRFDTILPIDPPDRAGMAQILRAHLGAGKEGGKDGGKGMGADPALDQAIASAAEALLAECAARHPGVSAPDQRRIALHEAGHVLVGVLSGFVPEALRLSGGGGEVRWPLPPYHTRATALAELRMLLAGRAAETVFCAAPSSSAGSGAASDLAQATRLALRIETEWGMGDGELIWLPELPFGNRNPPWLPTKIAEPLAVAERQARALIASHRETVEALAEALLIEREMTGPALAHWSARIRSLQRPARNKPASAPQGSSVIPFEPG
ncbi:MAG: AAA family ATPase [Pararhodobacter sp.]